MTKRMTMWWVRGECCGPFSVIRTIKFIIEKVNIPKTQINRQIDKDAAVHLAVCCLHQTGQTCTDNKNCGRLLINTYRAINGGRQAKRQGFNANVNRFRNRLGIKSHTITPASSRSQPAFIRWKTDDDWSERPN